MLSGLQEIRGAGTLITTGVCIADDVTISVIR